MKKCPYCKRRISYFTVFHEKKHGVYTCRRCKKDSKIKTDMRMLAAFGILLVVLIAFLVFWYTSPELHNNILGAVITAAAVVIFYWITPVFVKFVPLKKYREEEKQPEYEPEPEIVDDGSYTFNRAAFDEIKKRRNEKRTAAAPAEEESSYDADYVPVIKDVSAAHASSDAPLKKVHKHETVEETEEVEEEVKTYVPKSSKQDKPDGSTYTANRKF